MNENAENTQTKDSQNSENTENAQIKDNSQSSENSQPEEDAPQSDENTGVGSHTLKALGLSPDSICANCQHAVWHQTAPRNVRIFCLLMHVLVDEPLTLCDGKYITEK